MVIFKFKFFVYHLYSLYRATLNKSVQVWGADIAIIEDACLVVYATAYLGKQLSIFQKKVLPSSSAFPGGPWKMKATCYCEELCYITEDWNT